MLMIRKTVVTTVEMVEMVTAAPVPVPVTPVTPTLDNKPVAPAAPAKGHIVNVHDRWAGRPGGKLPPEQWKIMAISAPKERALVAGLKGSPAEGKETWVYFSELEFVRG